MRLTLLVLSCLLVTTAVEARSHGPDTIVVAQAGKPGGASGKDVSNTLGNEYRAPPRPSCPNIVGVWNSWASGLFGQGDTTFKADGTATHRSGIPGVWRCESGKLMISWGGETPKEFKLTDNKLVNPDGGVGFSR